MPDLNLTRVNNVPYSWNSCAHFFAGLPYKGITRVSFKETREVKVVHAAQQDGRPVGITAGIYEVGEISYTLLRDSAANLMADLTVLGVGSYGDAEFPYILQLFEPVIPPTPPQQVLIIGNRITGVEDSQEVGSDELVTTFTTRARYIVRTFAGVPLNLWSVQRTLLP